MADNHSDNDETRAATPTVPAPNDSVLPPLVEVKDIEAQQPGKIQRRGTWESIPLWKRRTLIVILSFLLFLIVAVSILYGVIYCMIQSGFGGAGNYPQFVLTDLRNRTIATRMTYAYNLTSALPLVLHDYNLTVSTNEGELGQIFMPGYYIRRTPLIFQADTELVISNETLLGEFGNTALNILTGSSDIAKPEHLFLTTTLSVNCGIAGFTFVHWSVPYESAIPFTITSLGNIGTARTVAQVQELKHTTPVNVTSTNITAFGKDVIFPVQPLQTPPPSPVSKIHLNGKLQVLATINFTNPAPITMNLSLVKSQVYSFEDHVAEVFVEDFALQLGNNSVEVTFWVNRFKGFVKTAVNSLFHGADIHQFSLRNITVVGHQGDDVDWMNKWFDGVHVQLPRVNYTLQDDLAQGKSPN